MTRRKPSNLHVNENLWLEFTSRHQDNSSLSLDPLYSLPVELIEAIEQEAPGFFKSGEAEFERELARLVKRGEVQDEEISEALHDIRAVCVDELRTTLERSILSEGGSAQSRDGKGCSVKIDKHFKDEEKQRKDVESRVDAYAGWLVMNPQFWEELDVLKQKWGRQIESWGRFPSMRHSFLGEPPWSPGPQPPSVPRDPAWTDEQLLEEKVKVYAPFEAFRAFYRRWCLERLESWELPSPLWPELGGHTTLDTFTMAESGVCIFIPWHMFRYNVFTLNTIVNNLRVKNNVTYLTQWITQGKTEVGYVRYRRIFILYVYIYLAMSRRYGEDLRKKKCELDHAFARYLEPDRDSSSGAEGIRKLRLELSKSLARIFHPKCE